MNQKKEKNLSLDDEKYAKTFINLNAINFHQHKALRI